MIVESERFGTMDLKENKIFEFPAGIPGFEDLRKFVILEIEQTKPIYWMQSTENKYIALPVINPFEIIEDYYVVIKDTEVTELNIENENDLMIMNVLVIPSDINKMTANLAAPIIINARTGIGKQIFIDAAELPIRFPVYESIMTALKGGKASAGAVQESR